MHECPHAKNAIGHLTHDIRGPLCNLVGFSNELEQAIEQLIAELKLHEKDLPDDFLAKARTIIKNDIHPCLRFSHSSIKKMSTCLDEAELGKNNNNQNL